MNKFTPGPWFIDRTFANKCGWVDITNDRRQVPLASCRHRDQEANAALIAAAPDLYDAASNALETLLACVKPAGGCDDQATILNARRMLSEAILKAGGKQ